MSPLEIYTSIKHGPGKDAQKQAQNTKCNAAYHLRKALEEVA